MIEIKKIQNTILSIILIISILFTTLVYSAYSTRLQIGGEAIVRSEQVIRITGIVVKQQTNGAYETYNNKYGKDSTNMYVTLPAKSSIVYEITITNKDTKKYIVNYIQRISHTNNNVTLNISLNIGDVIIAKNGKKFTITITNSTTSVQQETLVLKYGFTNLNVAAVNLSYKNTNTGVNCTDSQCMIDYLSNQLD